MDGKGEPPRPFQLCGGGRSGLPGCAPPPQSGSSPYSLRGARGLGLRLHPLHPSERRGPAPLSRSGAAAESRARLALNPGGRAGGSVARRPRPWSVFRPGSREARLGWRECAADGAPLGARSLSDRYFIAFLEGERPSRQPRGPAKEERARKARGGAAEGAGGAATSAYPHPQPPAASQGRGRSTGAHAGSPEQPRLRSTSGARAA